MIVRHNEMNLNFIFEFFFFSFFLLCEPLFWVFLIYFIRKFLIFFLYAERLCDRIFSCDDGTVMLHSLVFSNCQCEIDVEIYAIFFQYVQRLSISINVNLLFKLLMGTNGVWKRSKNENLEKLTVPPGLMSHTSFLFKKVENCEESCNTWYIHTSRPDKHFIWYRWWCNTKEIL